SGGDSMGPISGTNVVAGAGDKAAGGSQESIENADGNTFPAPAQNKGHIVRVGESAAAADVAMNVGCEIVRGNGQRCEGRISGAENFSRAHPYERVHVHQNGVAAGNGQSRTVLISYFIARIKK